MEGSRPTSRLLAIAAIGGVLALFSAVVAAFALPWRARGDGLDELPAARYAAFADGQTSLVSKTAPGGALTGWESLAVGAVPGRGTLADLPGGFVGAVAAHVEPGQPARVGLVTRRALGADGATTTTLELEVLDRRGLYLLGFVTEGTAQASLFDPAVPLLPARPREGLVWSAAGSVGGAGYEWQAGITDAGALDTVLGHFDDCVTVESTLAGPAVGGTTTPFLDQYCAGAGWVHGEVGGAAASVSDTVSATGLGARQLPDPVAVGDATERPTAAGVEDWRLTLVGSARALSSGSSATFAPVVIPTDPPVVVAATEAGGDLVALSVGERAGDVQWRLPTAGAVYSPPRQDFDTGRLYVGGTDGVLRALDARGLFLWSVALDDNIATRPAVVGRTVVVGGEDGHVVGVDDHTGDRRWEVDLGAAVVSSPAALRGMVAAADALGVVHALDPGDGSEVWARTMEGAVDAPLTEVAGGVLVADRSGALTLLDGDGETVWTADAGGGAAIVTEPAVGGGRVFTVDEDGDLAAVDVDGGALQWRRLGRDYVGSPAVLADGVVLARRDGRIDVLAGDGSVLRTFGGRDAGVPDAGTPSFTYGPTVAAGALWLADDVGFVHRLGPVAGSARPGGDGER